ncbi:hypothetical protein [Streptomyces sp. NPDC054784]
MSAVPTPSAPREPASRRERDDACPGTLRLHTADDGALARVRIPGGLLTATQAYALADAADRLGDGALHLTSRGNVQLRGLGRGDDGSGGGSDTDGNGCGRELADTLAAIGLLPSARHERVRNIVASPLSGLDGRGHLDVAPWVRELDRLLCASAAAAGLSGRFLFACDDGRGDVAALGADVTLVARDAETAELRIDGVSPDTPSGEGRDEPGGTALLRVPAAEAPRAALLAAELFLAAVRDGGTPCWRVRELPGAAALMAHGVTRRLRTARELAPPRTQAATDAVREPGAAPGLRPAPDAPGTRTAGTARTALCVTAPLGRLTTGQWRLLAATAAHDGDGRLRVTPWRGVVVPGLPGAPSRTAPDRLAELADAGLVTGPYAPLAGVGACAGQPGCAKSLTDVRGHAVRAADAAPAVPAAGARALPVHWSGCERRCGHPQGGAWVDVVATPGGYDVTVAGGPVRAPAATDVTDPARLAAAVAAARTTGPPP